MCMRTYIIFIVTEDVLTLCSRLYIKELSLPFKFEEIFIECLLCARHRVYYLLILYRGLCLAPEADILAGTLHAPRCPSRAMSYVISRCIKEHMALVFMEIELSTDV